MRKPIDGRVARRLLERLGRRLLRRPPTGPAGLPAAAMQPGMPAVVCRECGRPDEPVPVGSCHWCGARTPGDR